MRKVLLVAAVVFAAVSVVPGQALGQFSEDEGSVSEVQYGTDQAQPSGGVPEETTGIEEQHPTVGGTDDSTGEDVGIPFEPRPGYTCYPDGGPPNPTFGCEPDAYYEDLADDGEVSRTYTFYLADEFGNVISEFTRGPSRPVAPQHCYSDESVAYDDYQGAACSDVGIDVPEDGYKCFLGMERKGVWSCVPVGDNGGVLEEGENLACENVREIQISGVTYRRGTTEPFTVYSYDQDGNLLYTQERSRECYVGPSPRNGGGTDASNEVAEDVETAADSVDDSRDDGALPEGAGKTVDSQQAPVSGTEPGTERTATTPALREAAGSTTQIPESQREDTMPSRVSGESFDDGKNGASGSEGGSGGEFAQKSIEDGEQGRDSSGNSDKPDSGGDGANESSAGSGGGGSDDSGSNAFYSSSSEGTEGSESDSGTAAGEGSEDSEGVQYGGDARESAGGAGSADTGEFDESESASVAQGADPATADTGTSTPSSDLSGDRAGTVARDTLLQGGASNDDTEASEDVYSPLPESGGPPIVLLVLAGTLLAVGLTIGVRAVRTR